MKYKNILVALELSEDSKVLIDRAVALAELMNSQVSFVHIDGSVGEVYSELMDIQADPTLRPLNEVGNQQLHSLQAYTSFPIAHFFVGTGDLSNKLEETIVANKFDLLICGHHHSFWNKIVSYSRNLINHSPIDILVVPI
jgi:nucleotide-binding universal stress UspA family protein